MITFFWSDNNSFKYDTGHFLYEGSMNWPMCLLIINDLYIHWCLRTLYRSSFDLNLLCKSVTVKYFFTSILINDLLFKFNSLNKKVIITYSYAFTVTTLSEIYYFKSVTKKDCNFYKNLWLCKIENGLGAKNETVSTNRLKRFKISNKADLLSFG